MHILYTRTRSVQEGQLSLGKSGKTSWPFLFRFGRAAVPEAEVPSVEDPFPSADLVAFAFPFPFPFAGVPSRLVFVALDTTGASAPPSTVFRLGGILMSAVLETQ